MTGDLFNYAIKAPIDSVLAFSDGSVINLPIASSAQFDRAVQLKRLITTNCQGLQVTAVRTETGEDPSLSLKFGMVTPDLLSLKTNRQWSLASTLTTSYYRTAFDVPSDGIVPAQVSGTYGYAIVADAVSHAAYTDSSGISVALTQSNYSGFSTGGTLGFAVGTAGALKFTSDLYGKSVAIDIPFSLTSVKSLGTTGYVGMKMKMRVLQINGKYLDFQFPSVSVDPTGAIDFGAAEIELKFFVNGQYNVYSPGLLNAC